MTTNASAATRRLDKDGLQALFTVLTQLGYGLVGPTRRDGAIVYDTLHGVADLPAGWGDEQAPGHYRLRRRDDAALFGYTTGPQSWKRLLFPPSQRLFRVIREGDGLDIHEEPVDAPSLALIGVRACELHAIGLQDRVFLGGPHQDQSYAARREKLFVVAVNCTEPGGTCFCTSMQSGPRVQAGFDLALTEMIEADAHWFSVDIGSARGAEVLAQVPTTALKAAAQAQAAARVAEAAEHMGRELDMNGLHDTLYRNLESQHWDDVADRCLACGNCTLVCPTCFCSTVEDLSDLSGREAERVRRWDSCFNADFSYVVGGEVRSSNLSRYRQWMTHKMASWQDQFGGSGCVGCGRCITWCPVGIDLTEEVRALQQQDRQR